MTLTETQKRDLVEVACGYTRGYSARTCDSLCRLGYLTGDWDCGYYLTDKGRKQIETLEQENRESVAKWRLHCGGL